MRRTKPAILAVLTAGALGALTQAGAAPAPLTPGGSVNPIPTYSGTGMPTVDVLHDTGLQTMSANGMTVNFEEWAVNTNLNPSGVVFAFAISTSSSPSSLGATLPGYSGFMTAVESCDPFSSLTTCGTGTGTAARPIAIRAVLRLCERLNVTRCAGPAKTGLPDGPTAIGTSVGATSRTSDNSTRNAQWVRP